LAQWKNGEETEGQDNREVRGFLLRDGKLGKHICGVECSNTGHGSGWMARGGHDLQVRCFPCMIGAALSWVSFAWLGMYGQLLGSLYTIRIFLYVHVHHVRACLPEHHQVRMLFTSHVWILLPPLQV
jgi:hypothetical protein